jgi:lipopolysaccharide/colanic/teichoic acid biosynthesis glycosyltransferase
VNTLEKTKTNKIIIVVGDDYKFVELNRLKSYTIVYVDSVSDINNYTNIDYIILNSKKEATLELKNSDIKVFTIDEFLETKLHKLHLSDDIKVKPYTQWQYIQKRAVDLIFSTPILILASPLLAYSMYKIKKESPDGPILFKQKRVGKDGKEFVCYKFRSMRTDVDYFNHYTQENDPRIFKWGKFMRKTRIDELPQFLNVLKGEMHVVGPRAEWNELAKNYEKEIPIYHERHSVAPGITGWAQVNYPYGANIEDTKQKLMYDLYYIKNWSLMLEIKTIFKTIAVVLGRRGM